MTTRAEAEPVTIALARHHKVFQTLMMGVRLLEPRERRTGFVLAMLAVVVEMLQIAAMLAVLPVIAVVVDPTLMQSSSAVATLHRLAGGPSPERFVLLVAVAGLVVNVAAHVGNFLLLAAIERFTARCHVRVARRVVAESMAAPYVWFLDRNASALARIVHEDVPLWARELVGNLLRIVANGITVLAGVVLVVATAPWGGSALMLLVALVTYALLRLIRGPLLHWTARKRDAAERAMILESHIFSGVKDVKVSGTQDYFLELLVRAYGVRSRSNVRRIVLAQVPAAVLLLLGQAGLLVVTLVLWLSGSRAGLLASQMALIGLVTYRVVPAITRLSALLGQVVAALPWVTSITELRTSVAQAARRHGRSTHQAPVPRWREIRFLDVTFRYPGSERAVLEDVSLTIERGKTYGVIGASGAGKSTLVDLLLGLFEPAGGAIMLDGVPLNTVDLADWQSRIGYVPQTPYFTDDTLAANVAFGIARASIDLKRVRRAIGQAGLTDFLARLPDGLDTSLGDRALKISGGERQRIAIARALYKTPEVLVLDEATSALDPANQQAVSRVLDSLHGEVTVVLVSHQHTALASCDHVFVVDNGQIAREGRLDAVLLTMADPRPRGGAC